MVIKNYSSFLGLFAIDYVKKGCCDKEITDNTDNLNVVRLDDEIIGAVIIIDDTISLLMVKHKHQKKGYGSTILNQVEKSLFEKYDTIYLKTLKNDIGTITFCEKQRWQVEKEVVIDDICGNMVYMIKKKH